MHKTKVMVRFLALFERKEKTELAKKVKTAADVQRIRNSQPFTSPIVTLGSITLINPVYTGPHPYRGPEATDPRNAGKLFIPIRNFTPSSLQPPPQSQTQARRQVRREPRRRQSSVWRKRTTYTIDEESEDYLSHPWDAEISVETPTITHMIEPTLGRSENMRSVTTERTPVLHAGSLMPVPSRAEVVNPFRMSRDR